MAKLKSFFSEPTNFFVVFLVLAFFLFLLILYSGKIFNKGEVSVSKILKPQPTKETQGSLQEYFDKSENTSEIQFREKDPFKETCAKASTIEGKTFIYSNTVCMP